MPIKIVFHETYTFAFDRMADQNARFSRFKRHAAEGAAQLGDTVPICLLDSKAEGLPFIRKRLEVEHLVSRSIRLLFVVVDQDDQVFELVLGRAERRFPN